MDLNFIIRAAIPRQLQTASIRHRRPHPGIMHAALVTNLANYASAIVHTQGVSDALSGFQVTVHSRRACLPWAMRMDESHWRSVMANAA
jgi:hypothetical protein